MILLQTSIQSFHGGILTIDSIQFMLISEILKKPHRLYKLQSEPSHFLVGKLEDGTQVFMSIDFPELIAVLFDVDGVFQRICKKTVSEYIQTGMKSDSKKVFNSVFNKDWEELFIWSEELRLSEDVIAIEKVQLPNIGFYIQDLPGVYEEILAEGGDIDEETKAAIVTIGALLRLIFAAKWAPMLC